VCLFLFLAVTPSLTQVNEANSNVGSQVKLEWQDDFETAMDLVQTSLEMLSNTTSASNSAKTTNNNSTNTNNSTDISSPITNLTLSDIDFIGNAFEIRKLLLDANVTHTDLSKKSLQILLSVAVAFSVALLLFVVSTLWSMGSGIYNIKKEHGDYSYGQAMVASLFMVPYSAFYVMFALMIGGMIITALMAVKQITAVTTDSQIIVETTTFFFALKDTVTYFLSALGLYVNDSLPTADQLETLSSQVQRLVNVTLAVATTVQQTDNELNGWNMTLSVPKQ